MYLLLAVHLFCGKEAVTGSIIFSRERVITLGKMFGLTVTYIPSVMSLSSVTKRGVI